PRLPGPTWGQPNAHPVARGKALTSPQFTAVDLNTLLPAAGAQLIQIASELDCNFADFGARASKIIVELLMKCGSWPRAGIVKATYQDAYVSSPLVARLLIDTMTQVFSESGAQNGFLTIETRPPRTDDQRGPPWQIVHDWPEAADQKAVIELFGKQRGVGVSVVYKDVPHG